MIYVYLPAYNEEKALPRLVVKIDAALKNAPEPYRMVVLNDGSRDQTEDIANELSKKFPLNVLKHPVNLGLGQTMIDGLKHISTLANPDDSIVTLDCDDTHEPKYITEALKKIKTGCDLVILSRFQKGGGEEGLCLRRKIFSRLACLLLKIAFPIPGVRDYTCGFRVFRAAALQKAFQTFGDRFIRLPHLGFVVSAEILVKLRMLGSRMTEVPFVLRYDQKPGNSKNKTMKTILGHFTLVALYWGRSRA